ncbi:unnamed protein product [Parascedosporium putredinis]|uniref:DUF1996 domain-containing protein n=1 Tax=Parascedosporium putredinis TaxID=1442378 RepID=A0A9P1M646_9PEZI|nr:unnamed protein product [Parascedosporium putredinis]CAI7988999.1 unnamed protein product [Parascedosporium putredinis]
MKHLSIAATAAILAQNVAGQAMLRFACSQLVVDRVDPIVNPGMLYTPIFTRLWSTCTSCSFVEDLSNYWTAVMFFKNKEGQYQRVPQVGNGGPQGKLINNGGLDVYYIPSGKTTAFAKGFRMIAGDAGNTQDSAVDKSNICHRCWTSTNEDQFIGGAPCSGSDTVAIPKSPTCKMIRQTIIFPACWDGKNLDSVDHKTHVAYGTGGFGGASGGGNCPTSHPVKLPQVMFELMWNVTEFSDQGLWPSDGSDPFIYSMDLGGSAAHGDYVFGWKDDTLQRAMDQGCNLNHDCAGAGLHYQAPELYNACTIPQQAPEEVDGWLQGLPMGGSIVKV